MKNGDLKRFYPDTKIDKKDFVRYDDNKNIKVGTASSNDDAMSKAATQAAIEHAQLSVYKPGGSKTFAQLPTPGAAYEGYVYNVTDAFTTDSRFIEGAGKKFPAGTDVAVIVDGENYYLNVWVGGQDYDLLANIPIINQDLDDTQFTPQSGKYYRHVAGPAVSPTLQPFAVGDTLSNGDKIHFDKTANWNTFLAGLTYVDSASILFQASSDLILQAGTDGNGIYTLMIISDILYSTDDISAEQSPTGAAISAGWNASIVDSNGDYTLSLGGDSEIETINDTNPPTWNGVIIGVMEEAPASSFVDGKIYYYDGQYNAIPGAASVTAANVNSGDATSGQALIADGSGGAHWGNIGSGKYLHQISLRRLNSTDYVNFGISLQYVCDKNTAFTDANEFFSYFNTYLKWPIPISGMCETAARSGTYVQVIYVVGDYATSLKAARYDAAQSADITIQYSGGITLLGDVVTAL